MRKTIEGASGFTLIELLVVVAIIGILAAIAIPQFAAYRQRGYDARANSDLRNAANAEEAYFATQRAYVSCNDAGCQTALPSFRLSSDVTIGMVAANGAQPTFSGTSTSTSGTGKVFTYDAAAGGIQK